MDALLTDDFISALCALHERGSTPSSSHSRLSSFIPQAFLDAKEDIRALVHGKRLALLLDETTEKLKKGKVWCVLALTEDGLDCLLSSEAIPSQDANAANNVEVRTVIKNCLADMDIEHKQVVAICTDNASYNAKVHRLLQQEDEVLLHTVFVRCLPHGLSLMLKAACKQFSVSRSVISALP